MARRRRLLPSKKWLLLLPVVYLVGSAVVGTYLANRRTIVLPDLITS
jgi:hypothetical protein